MGKFSKKVGAEARRAKKRSEKSYEKEIQAKEYGIMYERTRAEKILKIAVPKMKEDLQKSIAAFMIAEVFMVLRSMPDPYGAKRLEQFYRKWLILNQDVHKHPDEYKMELFVETLNNELHIDINKMMDKVASEIALETHED